MKIITGMHRSGTSMVSSMLMAISGQLNTNDILHWIILVSIAGLLSPLMIITGLGKSLVHKWVGGFPLLSPLVSFIDQVSTITKSKLLKAWFVSLFFHFLIILVHFTLNLSLGGEVGLLAFLVFTPIVTLTLLLPSIQGLGLRESTYAYLLVHIGAPGR